MRTGHVPNRQPGIAASAAVATALALMLAGCGGGGGAATGGTTRESVGGQAPLPPDTGGVAAALAVLQDYYAAISAGDYARAYADWADGGRASGKTEAQLRKGFAATAGAVVLPGTPGRIEGAAGSRYIDVPVTVRARTTAGVAQCFEGTYTLRRVVVEGAPPEARRWHIYRGELRSHPAAACAGGSAPEAGPDAARAPGSPDAAAPPASPAAGRAVTAWRAPRTSARASAGISGAA